MMKGKVPWAHVIPVLSRRGEGRRWVELTLMRSPVVPGRLESLFLAAATFVFQS